MPQEGVGVSASGLPFGPPTNSLLDFWKFFPENGKPGIT
jgi:hypothetical protein